jgi:FG-GAP repeat
MSQRNSACRGFVVFALILFLTAGALPVCRAQAQVLRRPQVRAGSAENDGQSNSSQNNSSTPSPGDWQQLVKLTVGPGNPTFFFANSVGISGDTAVVSASPGDVTAIAGFVFVKSAQGWANTVPVGGLKLPGSIVFMTYAAIDGDTIVIGAPSQSPANPSYAYVFVKPAGGWTNMTPTAVLTPSDTMDGYFGGSVAIEGDTIVVGDSGYDSDPGAVFVYVKPAGGWANMTQTAKLTASDGVLNDDLGESVSIHGTTIAVGAPQIEESVPGGKAYIFVQPAGGWANMTQTAELTVPTAPEGSDIGTSIYVNDSWVLAGAPSFSNGGNGSAYVFSKPASGWANMTATAKLTAGDAWPGWEFGESVSGSGNIAIVGSSRRGLPPFGLEGGIYVFK